jgi:hypothetical protein
MPALLADVNIQGHVLILRLLLESDYWREIWRSLAMPIYTFTDIGLSADASDQLIWQTCQERELLLLTANRNREAPDSLEAALQAGNRPDSWPIFTLADAEHVRQSKSYAERVVERLLEYLLDIQNFRGTGRLYLP